jgi:hypothetical protein
MPKKQKLISIKYFLEKNSSLSHHIMKRKKHKNIATPFFQPHHPTPLILFFLKNKKNPPPSYFENQPNFSIPCHPRNNPLS